MDVRKQISVLHTYFLPEFGPEQKTLILTPHWCRKLRGNMKTHLTQNTVIASNIYNLSLNNNKS